MTIEDYNREITKGRAVHIHHDYTIRGGLRPNVESLIEAIHLEKSRKFNDQKMRR